MTTGRINQIAIDEKGNRLLVSSRVSMPETRALHQLKVTRQTPRKPRARYREQIARSSERAVETAPTREGGSHRSTLINGHRETWNRSEATEESK